MKRKILVVLVVAAAVFMMSGCGPSAPKSELTTMTAEQVVQAFIDAGFPIDNVITYTAETDVNHFLGRPNQYTSKTNFADTRADQYSVDNPVGGTVEVFNNASDAKKRYDYVSGITDDPGPFFQYSYLFENVYLRIDGKLSPEQAEDYENAFKTLQVNGRPQYTGEEGKTDSTESSKVYGLGEPWTVDGSFSVVFNSAINTTERSEYSGDKPQVVILTYEYENIGFEKGTSDFSVTNLTAIDSNKVLGDSYSLPDLKYPKSAPVGTKSVGNQVAFGLNNVSSEITVNVEVYEDGSGNHKATFKLPVQ